MTNMINLKLQNMLIESNPWWNKQWDPKVKERDIYKEINRYIPLRQIIAVSGLRRVGKSSLLFYIIKDLLKTKEKGSITYFSIDTLENIDIDEIIDISEAITKTKIAYLFLDEVQKLKGWQEKIKRIYDQKNIKIFLSGSESLFIKNYSQETLAGRIFEFRLWQLSFSETLRFKEIPIDLMHYKEISKELDQYLLTGGFPEMIDITDRQVIRNYINSIIDKTIFSDIPKIFRIDNISLLRSLIDIIIDRPGSVMEINDLSQELGIARQTISNYLFYMESAYLIKKLYNYSSNKSTSEKKQKKYYVTFPALALYYDNHTLPSIVENICVIHSAAEFFWRNPQKDEVDIVRIYERNIYPIEIKYSDTHLKHSLVKFLDKFSQKEAILVTRNSERTENISGCTIYHVPLVKYLLETIKDAIP